MFCSMQKTFFAAAFALVALLIGCATSASSEKAAAAQAQRATTDLHWDVLTIKRPGRDLRSRPAELPEETEVVELRPFFGQAPVLVVAEENCTVVQIAPPRR